MNGTSAFEDCTVISSGFSPEVGRPSPDAARTAAAEFGIDLSDHRSNRVDADLLDRSDAVFVMDVNNYRRVRADFPDARERTYFLGAFSQADGFVVPDPHGTALENFRQVYRSIAASIDGLADAV
jgi:protein-tyrosine phosphatase